MPASILSVPRVKPEDKLRKPAESTGELAGLARIDDRHRQAGVRQCGGDDGLVSAGCLECDDLWLQRLQTSNQMTETVGVGVAAKGDGIGPDVDFDPVFANVDPNIT